MRLAASKDPWEAPFLTSEAERMIPKPAVRTCAREDLAEVREIYALEVREGTASFELEPPSLAEMTARFAAIETANLPYLVAELDGGIAGFAYAGPYRTRPGYRHTVEDSVYVARWARRQGVGRVLLDAVIQRATACGRRQMVAIIGDAAHAASIQLHARAGFRLVGTLEHVGWKLGRWLDTVIMQRPLGPGAAAPPDLEPAPGS
jgi:L-amino acid N-acyltransferase YncA